MARGTPVTSSRFITGTLSALAAAVLRTTPAQLYNSKVLEALMVATILTETASLNTGTAPSIHSLEIDLVLDGISRRPHSAHEVFRLPDRQV
jgi:hypothetical protein